MNIRARTEQARLRRTLARHRPDFISDFDIAFVQDQDAEPAVRVTIILPDELFDAPDFNARVEAASAWIDGALQAAAVDRWPYMRFLSELDLSSAKTAQHR